jgi:hypothetical protein
MIYSVRKFIFYFYVNKFLYKKKIGEGTKQKEEIFLFLCRSVMIISARIRDISISPREAG